MFYIHHKMLHLHGRLKYIIKMLLNNDAKNIIMFQVVKFGVIVFQIHFYLHRHLQIVKIIKVIKCFDVNASKILLVIKSFFRNNFEFLKSIQK